MNQLKEEVSLLLVEDDDLDATAITRAFKELKLANQLIREKTVLTHWSICGVKMERKRLPSP